MGKRYNKSSTIPSTENKSNEIADDPHKLVDDLRRVLESEEFKFPGRGTHFATHTAWTNPCLNIAGLGSIGLPLSDRDAASIKAFERASYDGDIWSINANHISFENPRWEKDVSSLTSIIYRRLGINLGTDPPNYRLDRLLLLGPGFRYQAATYAPLLHPPIVWFDEVSFSTPGPCQDDETVANLFIILPSKYNGGEIQLSSSISTETFDISSACVVATCVLGWYNNFLCDIRPITMGHSIVLSYKIMKTTSVMAMFPDMTNGVEALRSILHKWRRLEYRESPVFRYVFYRLSYLYPREETGKRDAALEREDALKLFCLRSATNGTGYRIYLARLQERITSSFSDTSADTILDLINISTEDKLVSSMKIEEDSVIPSKVNRTLGFDHPNGVRYGILMFHEDDEETALLGLKSLRDILRHLRESLASSNMGERETMMTRYIALKLDWTVNGEDVGTLLADYAVKYENADLWVDAIKMAQHRLTRDNINNFLKATQVFGFCQVQNSLGNVIDSTLNLPHIKVDFLCELHGYACQDHIARESDALIQWCKDNVNSFMTKPLLRFFDNMDDLIQSLRKVLRVFGVQCLETIELGTIELIPPFVKFLGEHTHLVLPPDDAKLTHHLLNLSIDVVINDLTRNNFDLWQKAYSDKKEYVTACPTTYQMTIVAAFLWAIGACKLCERTDRLEELFNAALHSRGCAYTKVLRFYMPLMHELRSMTEEWMEFFMASHFAGFAQSILWEYLRAMLGTKSINPRLPSRRICLCSGCRCEICFQLDTFMLQPHTRILRVHIKKGKSSVKDHIEWAAVQGKDLVTFAFTSFYEAEITKLPHVLASVRWEGRVAEANEFLKLIGTKKEMEKLMGSDYDELGKAMRGENTMKLSSWSLEEIERRNLDLRRYEEDMAKKADRKPLVVYLRDEIG